MSKSPVIYALVDPRTDSPRYVGFTARDVEVRVQEHIKRSSYVARRHVSCWIRSLLAEGLAPEYLVLEEVTLENWAEREKFWINALRFYDLTNHVEGGWGALGLVHSPEAIAKIKAARAKQTFSPETRAKLSAVRTGKPRSAAARAAISAGRMGMKRGPMSEEQKARIAETMRKRRAKRFWSTSKTPVIYS